MHTHGRINAEIALSGSIYMLGVTFVSREPSKMEIDRILRECLAVAAKIDSKKDILATPWLRVNAKDNPSNDRRLAPYGVMSSLIFEASSQKIVIHDARPLR